LRPSVSPGESMSYAFLIAGLGFGDESKGATVDALCRALPVDLIVRYNGGCQAAHHVVLEDGRSHCFSQFGAGMLARPNIKTFLSKYMLVEPYSMMNEAEALSTMTPDVWGRVAVDKNAVVVTFFHQHLNRLRECARGADRHGSCGRGIGVAREMHLKHGDKVLLAGDCKNATTVYEKLMFTMEELEPEISELRDKVRSRYNRLHDLEMVESSAQKYLEWPANIVDGFEPQEMMIFEGAQGVMLDEKYGTAPHNTWTNTTFENADAMLDEAGVKERHRIGCIRTYHTRHGQGPFPTEDANLDLPELHNGNEGFQGVFRVGHLDLNLAKRAISVCGGIDTLAISHMDYLHRLGWAESDFIASVSANLRTHIGMLGRGPTAQDRTVSVSA